MTWKLIEGDCLEHLASIPDGSVDAVITDPPYGTTQSEWDVRVDAEMVWNRLRRCCLRLAPFVLFAAQPYSGMLVMSNADEFRYELVWDKANPSGHLNAKHRPLSRHELIEVFCREKPPYFPQMRKGRLRLKGSRNQDSDCYGEQSGSVTLNNQYYPTSILEFSNAAKSGKDHPNEKPVDLLRYLVRTYTEPGATILDPFAGSGTLGVAAHLEGRHSIMIEREPKYCDIIRARMAEVEARMAMPLFDGIESEVPT